MTTIPLNAGLDLAEADALGKLASVSDETMAFIEDLTDSAFWRLMLGDDLDDCQLEVDLLCASIRFRWAQVIASVKHPEFGALP